MEKDKFGAFSDYISVREAKELGIIDPVYHDIFADECNCGSERIIRNSLREVRCCDPRCYIKLGYYLSKMFEGAGIKGIGDVLCLRIMDMMHRYKDLNSHILFLLSPEKDYPFSLTGHEFGLVTACVEGLRNKRYTYASMIQAMSIPEFDTDSFKAFKGINSTSHFVNAMESEGGLRKYFANRGMYDPMKLFYISEFIGDILEVETKFFKSLLPSTTNVIKVVTTGKLTFRDRKVVTEQFIETCNRLGFTPDGSSRFFSVEDSEAVGSVHYVICDPGASTSKAMAARGRESREGKKILYTCDEFFELLVGVRQDILGIDLGGEESEQS